MSFDVNKIKKDFPILKREVNGKSLVYLDNAATTQKPKAVIDAMIDYYSNSNSNVHRGVHQISREATDAYENARNRVQEFINADDSSEIIFTKSTTESINLAADSFGQLHLKKGDEILISEMEHHSNMIPWQLLCQKKGAELKVIPINETGELEMDKLEGLLSDKTKLLALTHISNALGTVNSVEDIIKTAHKRDIPVLIDAAQSIPHQRIDVKAMDCDFLAFSGHKTYGPTGIGVLYGKKRHLENMPPYQSGGEMIKEVSIEATSFADIPYRFEAGTPNIAGAIGFGAALDYLNHIGFDAIIKYEKELLEYATEKLLAIPGLTIIGTSQHKAGVISFTVDHVHPHDMGTILDNEGIAVRTGQHCAQLVMDKFCLPATTRASFSFYNTKEDIDQLTNGILMGKKILC